MDSIPVADISAFVNDGNEVNAREAAAKQLAGCVRLHGCAAIVGHGLPEAELRDAFVMMRQLFDLSVQEKMRAPHPDGPRPHRGYLATAVERSGKLGIVHSNSESEKAFFADAIDWKETYDIGHEDNDEQKNIWLPEDVFPGFRTYMVSLYERLTIISRAILEGLMLGMDLGKEDCETLRQLHSPNRHQMRLAHYLPMTSDDQKDPHKIRLAAHKDFSSYTLLFQDSVSGLEFQNRNTGKYMPATPREGVLYLNIGDLMERYSNGFYPSAMHRVANDATPGEDGTIPGRFSIPYFTSISSTDLVYPMPSRVEIDGKANYGPMGFLALAKNLFATVTPKTKVSGGN